MIITRFKLRLFPVILTLTLVSFLAAAAIQLWSTTKIAEQSINHEIRNLTKQTHTSLQLFFDNQLGRAELLIGHFATNHALVKSLLLDQKQGAAEQLQRLYDSETGSNLELLFIAREGHDIWVDASSPFFSNLQGLRALPLSDMRLGRWYLYPLSVAGKPQVIALRKEPMIEPDSGQVVGALMGGLVLSGKLQMLNEARRYIGISGIALRYQGNLLSYSTDGGAELDDYVQTLDADDIGSFNRQNQFMVERYFLQLDNELSELEFLTLIRSASFRELQEEYLSGGLSLTLAIVLISLITTYLVLAVAVRPLLGLIGQANATIEQSLDMRAESSIISEYNALGRTLSTLINSFHRQKASLQAVNEELKLRVEQLQRSNGELDSFAYVASHDLKSPLRGIEQLSCWIEEDLGENTSPETAQHLKLMRSRVERMERLLDDLLTYSRVGRVKSELCLVNSLELVEDSFSFLVPPPGFSLRCEGDFPQLYTLRVPFEQVLRNLIGNAIKHHDGQQGLITVSAESVGDRYQFSVTDDGPGIAPKHHERVFGMFQTLRPRDEVEGSGIGLALVKKIVSLYGGSVMLSSDGERGCSVRFTWPNEKKLRELLNEFC